MLPEDIAPLLGHLFSCSFLVLLSLGGEKGKKKRGGEGEHDNVCLASLHTVFCFYKKGVGACECEIKVGEAVKHPKSKAERFLTAVGKAGVVGELQTTNSRET